MIDDLIPFIPADLLHESGGVFYSGRNAFDGHKPLYVLGLNPGGSPEVQAADTLATSTKQLLDGPDDWSAYRDEAWRNTAPGEDPMQLRVLHMMGHLNLQPGHVPCSNLVFVRAQNQEALRQQFRALADACWPFHAEAIARLEPRVILCFGQMAGDYVRRMTSAKILVGDFVEQNQRRWSSRAFQNNEGVVVVVATHPSRANWTNPETDPSALVAAALAGDLQA